MKRTDWGRRLSSRVLTGTVLAIAAVIGAGSLVVYLTGRDDLERRIYDKADMIVSLLSSNLDKIVDNNLRSYDRLQNEVVLLAKNEDVYEVHVLNSEGIILADSSGGDRHVKAVGDLMALAERVVSTGTSRSRLHAVLGQKLVTHAFPVTADEQSGKVDAVVSITFLFGGGEGSVHAARQDLAARLKKRAVDYSRDLGEVLRYIIRDNIRNYNYLKEITARMGEDPELESLTIYSSSMVVLASTIPGIVDTVGAGSSYNPCRDVLETGEAVQMYTNHEGKRVLRVICPLEINAGGRGRTGGVVDASMSILYMEKTSARRRAYIAGGAALIVILLSFFMVLFFQRTNIRLQNEIEEASHALEEKQKEVLQSEKLAAIGRLAAGVAHEINNPIGVVLGNSQMLLRDSKGEEKEVLESIERDAKRCSRIVRGLLDFSRDTKLRLESSDISGLVQEAVTHAKAGLPSENTKIDIESDPSLPPVLVDRLQIKQVFTNILLNALQSMSEGGRVDISVEHAAEAKEIRVSFQDTGCGMSGEHLGKVFEPFFTTKQPGEGVGLGLSLSYGIVQSHGGTIEVDSMEGGGSTFVIILPTGGDE